MTTEAITEILSSDPLTTEHRTFKAMSAVVDCDVPSYLQELSELTSAAELFSFLAMGEAQRWHPTCVATLEKAPYQGAVESGCGRWRSLTMLL
jgi:hypothetical protein